MRWFPKKSWIVACILLATSRFLFGADLFWTNNISGDFTNTVQWISNGNPVANFPASVDNANFTNNATYTLNWTATVTNANAFFNPQSGVITQAIGSSTWLITNSYILGQNAGKTGSVVLTSGTLAVTNSTSSGNLIVGQAGRGSFTLSGGTVYVDQLIATNSTFLLQGGNMTIYNGSLITQSAVVAVGTNSTQTMTLNILGGTNIVNIPSSSSFRVGSSAGATGTVIISGPNTVWSNTSDLFVGGHPGSVGSLMVISNGAKAYILGGANNGSYVGVFNTTNSALVVTDPGTVMSNSLLRIGSSGAKTLMVVSNGAQVYTTNINLGNLSGANINHLFFSDPNTVLQSADSTLIVGMAGASNLFTIANGAVATFATGIVGNASTASTNTVIITGSGSIWSNSGSMFIGMTGVAASVILTNGGALVSTNVILGAQSGSSGNLLIRGGTLVATNATQSSQLIAGSAGSANFHINGGTASVDQLWATNTTTRLMSGTLNIYNGSMITQSIAISVGTNSTQTMFWNMLGGTNITAVPTAIQVRVGDFASGTGVINVSGINTVWTNQGDLFIGANAASTGNRVVISNGAKVYIRGGANNGTILGTASSSNNMLLVSDSGTVMSNANLRIGSSGAQNLVVVSNGALLMATNVDLGITAYNTSIVTGAGSLITNSGGSFAIGNTIGNNTLILTNGGMLVSMGAFKMASTGAGSGTNNLQITGGGVLKTASANLGNTAAGFNNVLVSGSGSIWTNTGSLLVGDGTGVISNQLIVLNGGAVDTATFAIGNFFSESNLTIVAGSGSRLTASSTFSMNSGNLNLFKITNGGTVFAGTNAVIGNFTNVIGDKLIVADSGSIFSNISFITIGNMSGANLNNFEISNSASAFTQTIKLGGEGSTNKLIIIQGGLLNTSTGYVGAAAKSRNNTVLVDGTNSIWTNSAALFIGETGTLNQVTISNTAKLFANSITLGNQSGGSTNQIILSDSGSILQSDTSLIIGNSGSSNRLSILNNALAQSSNSYFGLSSGSKLNSALISGSGSVWTNSGLFSVGESGILNQVTISNGGAVYASSIKIGNAATANTNSILFSGTGSLLFSADKMITVGNEGSVNTLTFANGINVGFTNIVIGNAATASNNTVAVIGSGSVWSNANTLTIGLTGLNSRVTITNNGTLVAPSVILGSVVGGGGILDLGTQLLSTNGSSTLDQVVVGQAGRGTFNLTGGTLSVSQLISTNNGADFTNSIFNFYYGNLTTYGATVVQSNFNFVVGSTPGQTSSWVIASGTNSITANTFQLGAVASNVGSMVVSGPAFLDLHPTNRTEIGHAAGTHANSLIVTNGGMVSFGGVDVSLGRNGSYSNVISVSGSGSVLTNTVQWVVGNNNNTAENHLNATTGGVIYGTALFLGNNTGTSNNQALVAGSGSMLQLSGSAFVGNKGWSNTMVVADGGRVVISNLAVGEGAASSQNKLTISDSGSFASGQIAYIGNFSSFNDGVISNQGQLFTDKLIVGLLGSNNVLTVSSSGLLQNATGYVGHSSAALSNMVVVSGLGSLWRNTSLIVVGSTGTSSRVMVTNQGAVHTPNLILGESTSGSGILELWNDGQIAVTNSTSSGSLVVGQGATGTVLLAGGMLTANQIFLTNGGASTFLFSSGTLNSIQTTVTNGSAFTVGNGVGAATNNLLAGGSANMHSFADGLTVNTNALLNILASERLDDNTTPLLQGGTLNLSNFTETILGLVFDSGKVVSAGATLTAGTITNLSGGATFQTDSGTLGISTVIVGAGRLTKTGTGILTLSGANTYSGGTVIGAGTLQAGANNNLGNAAGTVTFDGGTLQTIGSLGTSARNLIFNSNKTGTIDSAGFDSTLSGTLTGNATTIFAKSGAGAITLSGDSSGTFLGNAQVGAGRLILNGALGGNVTVQSGATLSGSGSMASLWNQGTLNPGNSPGTITIHGAFTNSGTLVIELASASSYDMVVVDSGGTATLGGTLAPTLLGRYIPTVGTTFTNIITAAAGVNGTFSSITASSPTLSLTPIYFSDHVDLAASINLAATSLHLNPSQTQVANALSSAPGASSGDLATVLSVIANLSDELSFKHAYDEILPRKYLAMGTLGMDGMRAQTQNMRLHWNQPPSSLREKNRSTWRASLGEPFMGERPLLLAYNGTGLGGLLGLGSPSFLPQSWKEEAEHAAFFLNATGVVEDRETTAIEPGYNNSTAAVTMGMDWTLDDGLSAGLASGYSHTSSSMSGTGGKLSVETFPLWLNANLGLGDWYAHGAIGYGHNLYDIKREIEFSGIQREARAETAGHQAKALIEFGRSFHCGSFNWGPTLSADFQHGWIEPFEERGAQSLNLRVDRQEFQSFHTEIGGRLDYVKQIQQIRFVPHIRASWWHEYANDQRQVEARLAQGSDAFGVRSESSPRNAAVIGAGLQVLFPNNVTLSIDYQTQPGGSTWDAHSLSAGLNWYF